MNKKFDFFHKYLKTRAKLYHVSTETYLTSVISHDLRRDPKEVMENLLMLYWLDDANISRRYPPKKGEPWLKFFSEFQKKVIQNAEREKNQKEKLRFLKKEIRKAVKKS